jgi:transcriptional regulator with XRE-family HTH domain
MEAKGIKFTWLAKETGYSRHYIWAIREGKRPATKGFAERASRALGVPLDFLFLPIESSESTFSVPLRVTEQTVA